MKQRELQVPGCHDVQLHGRAWLPEEEPGMVVVLSHGLGEHLGRYEWLANRLVEAGCAVYAIDHRGHGRSGGAAPANIDRFDYVVSDLGAFAGRAQREHPGVPMVLFGHSMGGLVALDCALRNAHGLVGLALSAPALAAADAVPPMKLAIARLMSRIAPNAGALKLEAAAVSRDRAVVRAYEQDPLVFHGAIPSRTAVELLDAMDSVAARAGRLRLRVLAQHGTADRLVPLAGVQPVYQRLGDQRMRTLRIYEGLYHEIYNEPERERVLADLLSWLEAVRY
jgi:alpha-beta hydrolase superfamily lysophospholipase